MRKNSRRKSKVPPVEYIYDNISEEKMIEIQAEAYYRALKRIETEKLKINENEPNKKEYQKFEMVLFVLNILFWPWKINKKYSINNRIYDGLLVFCISFILELAGLMLWISGFWVIVYEIYLIVTAEIQGASIIKVFAVGILCLLLAGIFIMSGTEFEKVTDSNRIYAYSSCIIAIISCIIGIISLFKI